MLTEFDKLSEQKVTVIDKTKIHRWNRHICLINGVTVNTKLLDITEKDAG